MKNCINILWGITMLFICPLLVTAQENTVAAGGNASGSGGSVSYTIGQIDYQSRSDNDGSITEGVQQPYEIFITTDVDHPNIQLEAKVFPNPTQDRLTLSIDLQLIDDLNYTLLTNNGVLIERHNIHAPKTELQIANFPQGIYYLNVRSAEQLLQTFKIIKKQ